MMPLLPLCRGALATASGSFSVAVALPVATVFAERVFSSRTTQTSYSSLNQGSGTPGHPSQQALSAAHRARKAWSRMYASTSCSFGSKGSTYSTAASTTLPQQPLQTASSNASSQEAFEQQASDQGELLVEESTFKRLKHLQSQQGGRPVLLRVEVEGGGCSGFQYKFSLVDGINPDDKVFGSGDCKVLCDTISLEFLRGAKVEFEDSLMRSAFVINSNPNADKSTSCGCGSSFSVK